MRFPVKLSKTFMNSICKHVNIVEIYVYLKSKIDELFCSTLIIWLCLGNKKYMWILYIKRIIIFIRFLENVNFIENDVN